MSDIKAIARQALEGVTPGPWRWEKSKHIRGGYVITSAGHHCVAAYDWGTLDDDRFCVEDSRFAAQSRQLVPDLLAALETAERQRDAWHAIAQARQEALERAKIERGQAQADARYYQRKAGL